MIALVDVESDEGVICEPDRNSSPFAEGLPSPPCALRDDHPSRANHVYGEGIAVRFHSRQFNEARSVFQSARSLSSARMADPSKVAEIVLKNHLANLAPARCIDPDVTRNEGPREDLRILEKS